MGYINDDGLTRLWAKIKGLFNNSVTDISPASGNALTLTKGDGTTKQITTHDTTYSVFSGSTSSAAGTSGLVPAPSANAKTGILSTNGSFLYPVLSYLRSTTHQSVIFSLKNASDVVIYSSPELGIGDDILPATDSMAGIMTAADKVKLDAIDTTYISIPQSGTGSFGQFLRSNGDGTYYWSNSTVAEHDHDDIYYRKSEISDLLSGYLPITGGSMSGPITITRPGQSWVASATSPNIYNIANTNGANAWIGGKTLNGRITIGAYPSNDNYLYFSYYLDGRISDGTNGQDNWFYWAASLKRLWLGNNAIQFQTGADLAIIQNYYNDRYYNLIRNHNNGNVSVSASSAGLYLGYENTTFVNFLNGKMSLNSNGDLSVTTGVFAGGTAQSGDRMVRATNNNGAIELLASTNRGVYDRTNTTWIIYTNGTNTFLPRGNVILSDSLLLANNKWNNIGDDARFGDVNVGGAVGFQGLNGTTAIRFYKYGDTSVCADIRFDGWLRLGDNHSSSGYSGVYFGSSLVRTDGTLRAGTGSGTWTDITIGKVNARNDTGEAQVQATNAVNRIYMYANNDGRVGIYSIRADGSAVSIIGRANNSNAISAGGDWTFYGATLITDYSGTTRRPACSVTADGNRIAYFQMSSNTQVTVFGQNGTSGSEFAGHTWNVSSSDIRLKENVEDTDVLAIPVINAIRLRSFDWKSDHDHWKIGMIADEVEKIDPKLATGGGYDENGVMNIKSIDTFYMMGYVIKGMQELSFFAEDHEKRIRALEDQFKIGGDNNAYY